MVQTIEMNTLRENLVNILRGQLGPATERFVDRQIISHLNKSPEAVGKQDLNVLVNWINISLNVLTEDKSQVQKCIENIKTLAK